MGSNCDNEKKSFSKLPDSAMSSATPRRLRTETYDKHESPQPLVPSATTTAAEGQKSSSTSTVERVPRTASRIPVPKPRLKIAVYPAGSSSSRQTHEAAAVLLQDCDTVQDELGTLHDELERLRAQTGNSKGMEQWGARLDAATGKLSNSRRHLEHTRRTAEQLLAAAKRSKRSSWLATLAVITIVLIGVAVAVISLNTKKADTPDTTHLVSELSALKAKIDSSWICRRVLLRDEAPTTPSWLDFPSWWSSVRSKAANLLSEAAVHF